ncbi:DnaT-like ssDNA-binding domain-containing protein [Dryocola clanedunensis]
MAEELGWEQEAFDLALGEALSLGMVKADLVARVFWLPKAAAHNPPASVNVIKSWARAFELLPECELKWDAWNSLQATCYAVSEAMGKAYDMAMPLPKDKPKPLASGIQKAVNSKQILNPKNTMSGAEKTQPRTQQETGGAYPDEFEILWSAYPKREGSNPKNKAHSAWKARKREGVSCETMLEGVKRYRLFCDSRGQTGTGYVMQAQRFLGTGREFDNDWKVNHEATNNGQNTPVSGGSAASAVRAERERREREQHQRGGEQSLGAVGDAGGRVWESLGNEEWVESVNAMGDADFNDDSGASE